MKIYILLSAESRRNNDGDCDIVYKMVVGVFRNLDKAKERLERKALFVERTRDAQRIGDNPIIKELEIEGGHVETLWIEEYETE